MNGTQKIGLSAAILVVLGFGVYKQMKADQKVGIASDKTVDLPDIKGPDDIDKLDITNGDKTDVELTKTGDTWRVTKPVDFPANQANVKQLIDNLKELKATEQVEANASDDVKKSYELDPAHAVHIQAFKGADKKVDDYFGKNGGRGQMVMTGDRPGVFAATGYSSYLYTREVKNWRDTEIFKFDDANATQFSIEKKDTTLSFTKGDKWAGTAKGSPIERLDEDSVKKAIGAFKSLSATDFGDGKPVSETGLDAPESTVTILLKDNAGKYVLHVGKTATGSNRYAQKDSDPTIYIVDSSVGDWATADVAKFQKLPDGGSANPPPPAHPMSMGGMGGMPGMPPGMQMPPGHPH
jgi:hypothetical protein